MRIAILDDDVDQLELTKSTLEDIGHKCLTYTAGGTLLRALRLETFDLLVLDWHLPDISGPEVVRWARENLDDPVPILFVTNRREECDVVEGLSCGADDFMIKPMRPGELAARVQALLRRAYAEPTNGEQSWGPYTFQSAGRRVEFRGTPVTMTQREFDIALFMFRNLGRLLSRRYMLENLWANSNPAGTELMSRSLDTHISRVRNLLNLRPENGFRLSAVYGQGYRLEAVGSSDATDTLSQ
jgi:DNA-binding response OmpR family regulator